MNVKFISNIYMFRTRGIIFRKRDVTSRRISNRTYTCYNCLPVDDPSVSKQVHAGDTVKDYVQYNRGAVCWSILYDYITMHGANNIKFNLLTSVSIRCQCLHSTCR
jgi:hypothetical protein